MEERCRKEEENLKIRKCGLQELPLKRNQRAFKFHSEIGYGGTDGTNGLMAPCTVNSQNSKNSCFYNRQSEIKTSSCILSVVERVPKLLQKVSFYPKFYL